MINFTDATEAQLRDIWEWRNHESVRNSSHNRDLIPFEDHLKFIEGLNGDTSRLFFYVADETGGIGVFSLIDITDNDAVYGCYKNPALHTKGIGSSITKLASSYANETLGLKTLNVEIYSDNPASIRMFEKNGYKETERTDDLIKMRLDLYE